MPGIGPKPTMDYSKSKNQETAKLRYTIDQLLKRRANLGAPILHEVSESYELTKGQIKLLRDKEIVLVMNDDLGKYQLIIGPDDRIMKHRL